MLSHVPLLVTPWTVACQALLSTRFSRAQILEWVGVSSFPLVPSLVLFFFLFFPLPLCPHPTIGLGIHTVLLNVAAELWVGWAGALKAVDTLEGLFLGSPSVFD